MANSETLKSIPIDLIRRGRYQPRKRFTQDDLQELADSIAEHGVVQPIVVRPISGGHYELIAGERRWRAVQLAMLHEIPAVVRFDVDDQSALEISLIENLQRESMSAIEEAEGIERLVSEFHLRHEEVAQKIGKSRVYVTNLLRLLQLDARVRDMIDEGRLEAGHGKVLCGVGRTEQWLLANETEKRKLSVRQLEERVRVWQDERARRTAGPQEDVNVLNLAARITELIGCPTTIRRSGRGGVLSIRFTDPAELDGLLRHLPLDE
jgi:ParB family chromosome partitioning protein